MSSGGCIVPLNFLQKLHIYQTRSRIYVLGFNKRDRKCSVLKLNRQSAVLDAVEDTSRYTVQECNSLLRRIHEGNSHHGGLQYLCKAYGIIGCFKFTEGYYLFVITKREKVGTICGHKVYRIVDTAMLPVGGQYRMDPGGSGGSPAERRYRKLLLGLELHKEFYFSTSYPLPCTLQRNITSPPQQHHLTDNMFVWNAYLTSELRQLVGSSQWTVPLIHGFWQQRILSVFGRAVTVTVVARRSRHFAGTRYKKRGINDQGRVANEVEVEQIVDAGVDWRTGEPMWSSVVQLRGSIPLFWSQQPTPLSPKPDILLQRFDPMYQVTHTHFEDLRARYGNPVVVLNLLRSAEKRLRETLLRQELAAAVQLLNAQVHPTQKVWYIPWDFQKYAKQPGANILLEISTVIKLALEGTGIFVHHRVPSPTRRTKPLPVPPSAGTSPTVQWSHARLQVGVLRTNCIDCLDRTNVAQFAYGLMAFGLQLHHLGISDVAEVDPDSSMALVVMEMYEGCGHTLAMQYGGSEAHSVFFQRKKGDWEAAAQSKDMLTSIKRFYSNNYMDAEKQDAINLMLGNFIPRAGHPHIWDLDTDVYLHSAPWLHHSDKSTSLSRRSITSTLSPHPSIPSPPSGPPLPRGAAATPFAAAQLHPSHDQRAHLAETLSAMPAPPAPGMQGGPSGGGALSEEFSLDPIGYQASDGGWDFRLVLSQLLAMRDSPQQPAGGEGAGGGGAAGSTRKSLACFDDMLAKQPRTYQVRQYGSSTRRHVMWGALQQAFSFFWTLNDTDPLRSSQDASSPPQSPTTNTSPRAAPPARPFPPAVLSLSPALAAAQGLTSPLPSLPPASPLPPLQRRQSFQLPSPTRLLSDLAASLAPTRPPAPPAISPLNDILEVKGADVSPATLAALRGVPFDPLSPTTPGPFSPSSGTPSRAASMRWPPSATRSSTSHPPLVPSGSLLTDHFTAHTPPAPTHTGPSEPSLGALPCELLQPGGAEDAWGPVEAGEWQLVQPWEEASSCAPDDPPSTSQMVYRSSRFNPQDTPHAYPTPQDQMDHIWRSLASPPRLLEEGELGMAGEVVEAWRSPTSTPSPAWTSGERRLRDGYQRWVRESGALPDGAALQQQRQHYHHTASTIPLSMFGLARPCAAAAH